MSRPITIRILGDASNFARTLNQVDRSLEGFSRRTVGSLKGLGDRITGALGRGLKVGMGALLAGLTTTIGLGLRRLVGIEEAQAKMRGLGYTAAEIDVVMENALASVKGTAFGLADAATVAANVMASGVKPGKDLERTLRLVGDAATIAGAGFDEMGAIFGKVSAANRLTMEEVNQLALRGVPIMQWLADAYGVTGQEARKMVEQGKVDFETFRDVIEDNIGGAALRSGETTMGALRNVGAAASRLGAVLAGPIFSQARGFFLGVIDWLDDLTVRAEPFAQAFGDRLGSAMEALATWGRESLLPVLERLGRLVQDGVAWYRDHADAINRVLRAVVPAAGGIAALASAVSLAAKAWQVLRVATPLGLLLAAGSAIVYLWQNSETFRDVVTQVAGAVQAGFGRVIEFVQRVVQSFRDGSSGFESAGSRIRSVVEALGPLFESAFGAISAIVSTTVSVLTDLWDRFGATLLGKLQTALDAILQVLGGAITTLTGIFNLIKAVLTGNWGDAWRAIRQILSGALDMIVGAIRGLWNGLATAFEAGKALLSLAWGRLWDGIKSVVSSTIGSLVEWVTGLPRRLRDGISGTWSTFSNFISSRFAGVKEKATEKFRELIDWVRTLPGRLVTALGNLGRTLWGKGREVMQGFIDGIKSLAASVPQAIFNAIPGSGLLKSGWNKAKGILGLASGTKFAPGGWAVVGEQGRELVRLPRGAEVIPNSRTRRILDDVQESKGSAPAQVVIEQHFHGFSTEEARRLAREGTEEAFRAVRVRERSGAAWL